MSETESCQAAFCEETPEEDAIYCVTHRDNALLDALREDS